jgi:selenide,water dikinase
VKGGTTGTVRDLVLVGGGHSHVEVLRRFASRPPARTRITLVAESPTSIYSGMVPGLVAGRYARRDVEIDVAALAARAGARLVTALLTGVDPRQRRLHLEGRSSVSYDVASLNLGSAPVGLDLPGISSTALPARPIAAFLDRLGPLRPGPRSVVVVGGGAGGVELAFALRHRFAGSRVSIVEAGARLLPHGSGALSRLVQRCALASGIALHCARRVIGADGNELLLGDGGRLEFDRLVWTAGSGPVPALSGSDLPRDRRGFTLVESTLRVRGHTGLFAAGDCATLADSPDLPKAGVYAVRQGPFLTHNLRAMLEGQTLRRYRPQRDFLTLLNLADGSAVGGKWGLSFRGRWAMALKDRIDRRFVARYRSPEA